MTSSLMLDTHCHLSHYLDPVSQVRSLDGKNIVVIAVTNLPSEFQRFWRRFGRERRVRVALGVHPLHAASLPKAEWSLFERNLDSTRYVGEIGLDFTVGETSNRAAQLAAFRRILQACTGRNKVISVHSRRAEEPAYECLQEFGAPVILHWYSGGLAVLDKLLTSGHFFSINPAMVRSQHGRRILARVPPDRVLAETDGPYVLLKKSPVSPPDVDIVYRYLAEQWRETVPVVTERVYQNFRFLLGDQARQGSDG